MGCFPRIALRSILGYFPSLPPGVVSCWRKAGFPEEIFPGLKPAMIRLAFYGG
jgi:hypothetical protein